MGLKDIGNVTYFKLNNQINIPVNGQIPLHRDKEALEAFFKENVEPYTKKFDTYEKRINWLVDHNYYDKEIIDKYSMDFITELHKFITGERFRFKSFMSAYKFYQQYALKTDDGEYYLESIQDRVLMNALMLANGNEELAKDIAEEMIHQRYQPATPTFLSAGKARAGELISCFLYDVADSMNSIGRAINSALQLSKIGGGVGQIEAHYKVC